MNHFDWSVTFLVVKCCTICLRVTPRQLEKPFESLLMTLVDGQHIRQSSLHLANQILKY